MTVCIYRYTHTTALYQVRIFCWWDNFIAPANISAPDRLSLDLLAPELFYLILAHPVYQIWIIQEPTNTLELWNKLHFEEKKTESIYHV